MNNKNTYLRVVKVWNHYIEKTVYLVPNPKQELEQIEINDLP